MKAARLPSRVTYANITATLALALALSTGGAYAAAQIGAGDIKDDAVRTRHITDGHVTKNDLKDGAVTRAKLAPSAQTQIVEYNLGPHTFAPMTPIKCTNLDEAPLTPDQVVSSVWTGQLNGTLEYSGVVDQVVYAVPGLVEAGDSEYQVRVQTGIWSTAACVVLANGPGETFENVRLIRTVPTQTVTTPD